MLTITLILLIILCIVAVIIAIWINCCIHINIQRRFNDTLTGNNSRQISINDNYIFSRSNENYNTNPHFLDRSVPPIIPVTIGEKVESELQDIIVIVAENN